MGQLRARASSPRKFLVNEDMREDLEIRKDSLWLKEDDPGIDSGHATESEEDNDDSRAIKVEPYTLTIVWKNVVKFIILHLLAILVIPPFNLPVLRIGNHSGST